MVQILKGITPAALPWARSVEKRIGDLTASVSRLGAKPTDADKTAYSEYSSGQNLAVGTNGRVAPTVPVALRYVSTTGLFEVTVSLAGMVRDGATLGLALRLRTTPTMCSTTCRPSVSWHRHPWGRPHGNPSARRTRLSLAPVLV